jgi:transposase
MSTRPMISIPLDVPDVRVLQVTLTKQQEYLIDIESTLTVATCTRCGHAITELHGSDAPIQVRHLPLFGHPVYLRLRPKRFRCRRCTGHPTSTQQLEWYTAGALHTNAYEHYLLLALIGSTISDVCRREDVAYDTLLGTLDRWLACSVDWSILPVFHTLGLDEIALKKGHRDYVAIISGRTDDNHLLLLAVLPDRSKATILAWIETIPAVVRNAITSVCLDMWAGYVSAAEHVLSHATIIIDRFHVAQHYRDCVDSLRKHEHKRLAKELPEAEVKQFKDTLWPFRKRPHDLQPEERSRLATLFAHSPQLKRAYDFREDLTLIFDTAPTRDFAALELANWEQRVADSGLTCFDPFLKLLATWRERILNYFIDRQTSGFVEGLNNKVKVLKRRCYGITNVGRLFQRLTLDLVGYQWFSPWNRLGGAY